MKNFRSPGRRSLPRKCSMQLELERLEDRSLLAVDVTLTGTQVSFIDDDTEVYPLALSVNEDGQLQYNLRTVIDGALISEVPSIDLDTTQPGDQILLAAAATQITIDLSLGGGGGSITGIDSGAVSFAGAGLLLDWQSFTADSTTTFDAGSLTRTSGSSNLAVSISGVQELMLIYGDGNDTILAADFGAAINATTNGGDDLVIGTDQNDSIWTGLGNDFLDGRKGDDSLLADEPQVIGNDTIYGRAGDDFLYGGLGDDELHGGNGFDTAAKDLSAGQFIVEKHRLIVDGFITNNHDLESFFINGSAGDDLIDVSQAKGACVLSGGEGNDTLVGSDHDDSLYGDGGNDIVVGRRGNDQILGGTGDDSADAGLGDDWIEGEAGNDSLKGGEGQDRIRGGADDDLLNGGSGDDDLDGEAGSDEIFGGAGSDFLSEDVTQSSLSDVLHGGDGDDTLQVFGGENLLFGDGGNDFILSGDAGLDEIQGGAGNDTIQASFEDFFAGGAGVDTLSLATPVTTARITNQSITLDDVARARAGLENFSLSGIGVNAVGVTFDASGYTAGSVSFVGSWGPDVLIGSENADTLVGSTGNDSLDGRGGNDILRADADDDLVLGGAGRDDYGFYYLFDLGLPNPPTRQQILDLLFAQGIEHDIARNERLAALIS